MLVVMTKDATPKDIEHVIEVIENLGLSAHPIPGAQRTAIGITGNKGSLDPNTLESLPGVFEAIPVSKPFKQVSLGLGVHGAGWFVKYKNLGLTKERSS